MIPTVKAPLDVIINLVQQHTHIRGARPRILGAPANAYVTLAFTAGVVLEDRGGKLVCAAVLFGITVVGTRSVLYDGTLT